MASDEDNFCPEDCLPNSNIGGLILKINKMLKKPVIDFDLNETLDSFLNQLNDTQRYLSNGIFNVKFAEAGLFLQSSAALYSKKVDLLWDNALEYQMQLCSYNKSGKENAEESTKIVQKMNRNKRKKIIVQNGDTTIYVNENLTGIVDRCFKILEWCDTTPYYEELKDRWKAFRKRNKRIKRFIYCEVPNDQASNNQDCNTQLESAPDSDDEEVVVQKEQCWSPICDIYFPINQNVDDVKTGEKLCNYGDMYVNSAASCLESIEYNVCNSTNPEDILNNYNSDSVDNNENTLNSRSSDLLLQAYLRQRHFKFRTLWSQELGDHFEALQQSFSEESHIAETSNQSIHSERGRIVCQNNSYVNLTRLPEELMAEYLKENDLHVRNLIQDLLLKQTQPEIEAQSVANAIKKGSERISNADSLFVDGTFNEEHAVHTDVPYVSQQSNADSGIFCNTMEGLSGIADNEEQITNTGADSGIFCSITESIVDSTQCDEHTDAPSTSELSNDCIEHGDIGHDNNNDIGHDNDDDIDHGNNHDVEQIILEQLNQNINLEVGRNETVECIEVDNLPPFLPIHCKSIIKPVKDCRTEKQNLKRKLQRDQNSEETPKRRKSQKFRWLKTTSATLAQFEKFFVKNYAPESGEVDEDWIAPAEEDSDETDSISADLGVLEDLDETNENLAAITLDSVDITEKTSESILEQQHMSLQVQEKDSMTVGEESTFDCMLRNFEGDVEVPNITSCTNEPECDSTQVDESEIEDEEIAGPSNSAAVAHDFSRNRSSEMEALQRLRAVNEWRRFIEPKLQEAERNANFDIHEYGTHIMDAIPPNENLNFCNIAQGKQASEVARLFLASLQLANTYNVELLAPTQGELANDKFELKLLTRERYHEHLDEYEAPSENTFREKLARVQALKPSAPLHSTPKRYSSTSKYKAKRQRLS